MSTLEDKILDGPTVNYCDAEDDDIRSEVEPGLEKDEADVTRNDVSSLFVRPDQDTESIRHSKRVGARGNSSNTGPKGVLEDYRKQSAPKTSKYIDDKDLEAEFSQLLNDDTIIKTLAEKRLAQQSLLPTFGTVLRLQSGPSLLDALDKENKAVLVMVHVYAKDSRACRQVDKCLDELAVELSRIKFVTIDVSIAGLSDNFRQNGVPALLAYRGGNFLKSIVQLEDLLDKDFDTRQLRELLIEHNLII